MSDEAAGAAVEAAPEPVEAPTPAPEEAGAEATTEDAPRYASKQEARQGIQEKFRARRAAAKAAAEDHSPSAKEVVPTETDAAPEAPTDSSVPTKKNRAGEDQPMAPDGKYAPKAKDEPPAAGDEAAAGDDQDVSAADGPQTVEIPVPEGHWLRDQGRESIAVPADQERIYRGLLKDATRNREVEEAQSRILELQRELARVKAREEVYTDPEQDPLRDPQVKALYEDILRNYGEEEANRYLRGVDARSDKAAEKAAELEREAEMQVAAERFKAEVWPRAAGLFQAWTTPNAPPEQDYQLRARLQPHLLKFAEMVDKGLAKPDVGDFLDTVLVAYANDPATREWAKRQSEAKRTQIEQQASEAAQRKAEADAKAREEQRLRDAAERGTTKHPLGRVPSTMRTDRQSMNGEPDPIDKAGKSADQIKKEIRQRLFSRS